MIELSHKIPSIELSIDSAEYWSRLVVEVKKMTAAWRNNDKRQQNNQ